MSQVAGLALSPSVPTWEEICRRDYGLTPREFGTLVAIIAFVDTVGGPMPRSELDRTAAKSEHVGEIDTTTPGRLMRMGLIGLRGYQDRRFYSVTQDGRDRVAP